LFRKEAKAVKKIAKKKKHSQWSEMPGGCARWLTNIREKLDGVSPAPKTRSEKMRGIEREEELAGVRYAEESYHGSRLVGGLEGSGNRQTMEKKLGAPWEGTHRNTQSLVLERIE